MDPIPSIVLKRLMIGFLALWIVTVIIFATAKLLPVDIATEKLGQAATPESLAAFREKFDSNRSFVERLYKSFLPAMTLTLIVLAYMMRTTRAAIPNLLTLP